MDSTLSSAVTGSCSAVQSLLKQQATFDKLAAAIVKCLRAGNKVLTCGNGGSASIASQMVVEKILPLTELAPGQYTLRIKVQDSKRNQTITPSADFTVL